MEALGNLRKLCAGPYERRAISRRGKGRRHIVIHYRKLRNLGMGPVSDLNHKLLQIFRSAAGRKQGCGHA